MADLTITKISLSTTIYNTIDGIYRVIKLYLCLSGIPYMEIFFLLLQGFSKESELIFVVILQRHDFFVLSLLLKLTLVASITLQLTQAATLDV